MSGKNVLVTGANGHVGYTLTRILVEKGYNVRASVRNKNNPKLVSHLDSLNIEIVEMDLMEPETIESAMQNMDGLFQVAAVYQSWAKNPDEEIINPSIIGGINALKAAKKAGVKKVVFTSSTAAIGRSGPNGKALNESDWNSESKHLSQYVDLYLLQVRNFLVDLNHTGLCKLKYVFYRREKNLGCMLPDML